MSNQGCIAARAFSSLSFEYFIASCRAAGVGDCSRLERIATETIAHLKLGKTARVASAEARDLELRWYRSLVNGTPDYAVYDSEDYLAELYACWIFYSRKYLRLIEHPRTVDARLSLAEAIGPVESAVDLGCGIGFTTAALREIYPSASVVGTNLAGTIQWRIAESVARRSGADVATLSDVGYRDLVFASEYFEHIEAPVAHLVNVLDTVQPRALLVANTFGAKAIGHFDEYLVEGKRISGALASRRFNQLLRSRGYEKVATMLWNGRPAYWRKVSR